uniref:Uncharacterized protein n=1 Tax=Leptocylindrus danicus TaxID=163516 RepID=A0A7S2KDI7_9STRA
MAIRKSIHGKFHDRFMQRFFYVADLFMNTAYVNILYYINLTNIMQAATPLEAILNALALEYLFQIDEELGSSAWWDPDRRWIRAGSVEIILQNSIERDILKSPALFAQKYNIPVSDLIECCDGDLKLFHNFVQAVKDAKDVTLMTRDEILYERCRLLSVKKNNRRAMDNFDKQVTFFGGYPIERSRISPGKNDHAHGLFNNYRSYRTWSRWSSILYLSPVPELDKEIFCGRTSVLQQELEEEVPAFMFGGCPSLTESSFKLWRMSKDVLTLKSLGKSITYILHHRPRFLWILFEILYQSLRILCILSLALLPMFILCVIFAGFACLYDPELVPGNLVSDRLPPR